MASFCAPLASSSSAIAEVTMAEDIMAADVIITSAAPTVSIRILVLLCAGMLQA
jgi:hypothetical protein